MNQPPNDQQTAEIHQAIAQLIDAIENEAVKYPVGVVVSAMVTMMVNAAAHVPGYRENMMQHLQLARDAITAMRDLPTNLAKEAAAATAPDCFVKHPNEPANDN